MVKEPAGYPQPAAMSTALAIVFYGAMLGGAWLLGGLWLKLDLILWAEHRWGSYGTDIGLGLALGLSTVYASRVLERRTTWAQVLTAEFRKILGPITAVQAFVFAVTSGVAEEVFFRSFLQQALSDSLLGGGPVGILVGLVLASLIFGGIHIGPDREKFRPWTIMAVTLGLCFGGLYLVTGSIVGPVVAHFTINFINLLHISRSGGSSGPERHSL